MKIAHISDLHLNTMFNDSSLRKTKQIVKYIKSLNVDHLIISGDLTDNADESDLFLLRKLLEKSGFLKGDRLSVVPGNHDIFGGPQRPEDIFSFPSRCKETNYDSKIKQFNKYFEETFDNVIYKSQDGFPFAKIINDNILVIGVNSNAEYSSYKNPFASNGEIKLNQFSEIDKILEDYSDKVEYKILVIHHHFNKTVNTKRSIAGLWQSIEKQTMKLRKKKRLLSLFEKYSVDLILHGHIHYNELYNRNGLIFMNGGASVSGYTGKSVKINIIKMASDQIECELHKISEDGKIKIEELYKKRKKYKEEISPLYFNVSVAH